MKRIICTLLTLAIICALGMCAFAETALNAGDIINFGTYPQTAYGGDDTPIEWIVLDVQEGRALLLSRYGLDVQKYNNEKADVTWESCTLRAWLNSDFMNRAFSEAEQDAIYLTDVDSSPEQCLDFQAVYGKENTAEGGSAVQDKVFLLSYAEANLYLGVDNT